MSSHQVILPRFSLFLSRKSFALFVSQAFSSSIILKFLYFSGNSEVRYWRICDRPKSQRIDAIFLVRSGLFYGTNQSWSTIARLSIGIHRQKRILEYCSLGVNNGHLRLQWDGCDALFTCAKNVSVLTAYARARVLEWLCTCIGLSVISRVMRFRFVKICVVSHFEKRHSTAWAEFYAFLLKMSSLCYARSTTFPLPQNDVISENRKCYFSSFWCVFLLHTCPGIPPDIFFYFVITC